MRGFRGDKLSHLP